MNVSNPFRWIEEMFKDCPIPNDDHFIGIRQFRYFVAVCGRVDSPGPRDERWEYILDVGRDKIERVLTHKPIGKGPHFFIFPDRWMVPGESVQFAHALTKNPDVKKFKAVYVVTHAPYLVSDCVREQVKIVTKEATT